MPTIHHPFKFGPGECCCPCWFWSDNFNRKSAEDTGWQNPSDNSEFNDGDVSWSDAGNVYLDDGAYATVAVDDETTSKYMIAHKFGFAVPVASTIVGIEVRIQHKAGLADSVKDRGVYVHRVSWGPGPGLCGQNKAKAAAWGIIDEGVIYGASNDFWTLGLGEWDINADDFGVAVSVEGLTEAECTAYIDLIEMKVWYTNAVGTNVGDFWEEVSGEWGIDTNTLVEDVGGGSTPNSRIMSILKLPTGSKNEAHASVSMVDPVVGNVYILYLCTPIRSSAEPRVEAEFITPSVPGGPNWRVTIYAGGKTDTKDMFSAGKAHGMGLAYVLDGCIEPLNYEDPLHVAFKGSVLGEGEEYPWLDDVTVEEGRMFGVGHNNPDSGEQAVFDDFYITELTAGNYICDSCFCRCDSTTILPRELTATFYDCTGDLTCLEGEKFDLDWEWFGSSYRWYGQRTIAYTPTPATFTFIFNCGTYDPDTQFIHFTLLPDITNCCGIICDTKPAEPYSTCDPLCLYFGGTVGEGPWQATGLNCCLCDRVPAGGTYKICVSARGGGCGSPAPEAMALASSMPRLVADDPLRLVRMQLWLGRRGVPEEYFDEIVRTFGDPPKVGCGANNWLRRVRLWVKERETNHGN